MSSGRVVLASGNRGKLAEFEGLAADLGITLVSQGELDICGADETGLTFVENALIKARHAARESGLPAIADDSGLCVDALHGAPGLFSSRYAGTDGDSEANNAKLLAAMTNIDTVERQAHFVCVLAYLRHPEDPSPIIAEGFWHGRILEAARGNGGFGYDALFFDPLLGLTAAEMPARTKRALSHRGQAVSALRRQLHRSM
ncbi:MAG: RdgB/HAM1 family non-canonical purine NTP pyrophosphatase [Xanthomonadales bacterium]|nr:RdgB/HAM1 family non-canonical purine NTP pyrophosphatase [Xanthomonadales bacterium]